MASRAAQAFMDGLREVEQSRDPEALVRLFAPDAELENPARQATLHGTAGARRFWTEYRQAFERVQSEFTRVEETDGFASLEWTSDGQLPTGTPIRYRGVSLVEFDDEGHVKRFCTYYDSAAFLPQGSKHQHQQQQAT
ncbi:MAG TPA: nuclear transport factor 2 family protein [Tepidisphaeraceae bacterium]|jgi:ketosteroid isomerase-like protein